MVRKTRGDLLKFDAGILCHQVNYFGVMGGGIAASIYDKALSNDSRRLYKQFCYYCGVDALGKVQFLPHVDGKRWICNLFCQDDYTPQSDGGITSYDHMLECLFKVETCARKNNLSVAVPGYMGCGIAGGDWDRVEAIIHKVFDKSSVLCTIVYWVKE